MGTLLVKYRLQGTFYCPKNSKKTTYYWSPTFYLQIKSRTPVKSPLLLLSHPDSKSTANQYFTHFATKVRLFIRAGLYPNSQKIHVKQGAGRYFHNTSFNGRLIHFQVLRFIIFQIIGKIYHHSERF